MSPQQPIDDATLNSWHVVVAVADLERVKSHRTALLGRAIKVDRSAEEQITVSRCVADEPSASTPKELPSLIRYGYVWTTFGPSPKELFRLDEYYEEDRRNIHSATFGVHVSAPRAVENFLDMAHFAFVHAGYLGEEPYTEIPDYNVEICEEEDEIIARDCRSFRTRRSETDRRGVEVVYLYRVMQPYLTLLTMPCASDPSRQDIVALFVQPVDQERINAHMLLSVVDKVNDDHAIRRFQQVIFGQDKPILENQFPKRLPLDPRAETPIRADKLGVAYRRWLRQKGVTYGVIPASS